MSSPFVYSRFDLDNRRYSRNQEFPLIPCLSFLQCAGGSSSSELPMSADPLARLVHICLCARVARWDAGGTEWGKRRPCSGDLSIPFAIRHRRKTRKGHGHLRPCTRHGTLRRGARSYVGVFDSPVALICLGLLDTGFSLPLQIRTVQRCRILSSNIDSRRRAMTFDTRGGSSTISSVTGVAAAKIPGQRCLGILYAYASIVRAPPGAAGG